MQRYKNSQIEWLQFDLLSAIPKLKHGIYLRQGGVSQPPYDSLNLGFYIGDAEPDVHENRKRIERQQKEANPFHKKIVRGVGCHQDQIACVDHHSPEELLNHDGLISSTPGIALMMNHADCQIGLFYDPVHHAIANVHAGWRGSVLNIFSKTVEEMKQKFGSNPANLLVCISPSLGPEEAEFIHYKTELPEHFWPFQVRPTYFDFWAISEWQLQKAGILPHHIEMARISTFANPRDFFSYRRDKKTGRNGVCITLL